MRLMLFGQGVRRAVIGGGLADQIWPRQRVFHYPSSARTRRPNVKS
jgi:hypothetical protein